MAPRTTPEFLTTTSTFDRFDVLQTVEHARALGANALIAVRYDATEIMPGVSEVLCYGTATRLAPIAHGYASARP